MAGFKNTADEEKPATFAVLSVAGLGVMLGLVFCSAAVRRQSSRALRGRLLSNRMCGMCPSLRDSCQRCGSWIGIPGCQLGAKDSLETLCEEDEFYVATYSQRLRQLRRDQTHIVGVKMENAPIKSSAPSGFKWKKKWRERRMRNKKKRKQKHEERKLKRMVITALNPAASVSTTTGSLSLSGTLSSNSNEKDSGSNDSDSRKQDFARAPTLFERLRRSSVKPADLSPRGKGSSVGPLNISSSPSLSEGAPTMHKAPGTVDSESTRSALSASQGGTSPAEARE